MKVYSPQTWWYQILFPQLPVVSIQAIGKNLEIHPILYKNSHSWFSVDSRRELTLRINGNVLGSLNESECNRIRLAKNQSCEISFSTLSPEYQGLNEEHP